MATEVIQGLFIKKKTTKKTQKKQQKKTKHQKLILDIFKDF